MVDSSTLGLGISGIVLVVVGYIAAFLLSDRQLFGTYKILPSTGYEDESAQRQTQGVTFVISVAVQIVGFCLGLSVLNRENVPPALALINEWETAVQGVELGWYLIVGAIYAYHYCTDPELNDRKNRNGVPVWARYLDWVFTTPVMLFTAFFLILYFHNNWIEVAHLTDVEGRTAAIVLMIVADLIMLAIGFTYEWTKSRSLLDSSAVISWFGTPINFLLLGFIPLLCAFIPHFYLLVDYREGVNVTGSYEGTFLFLVMILTWSLYGAVAILISNDLLRSSFYNIIDLLSKNAVGFVVYGLITSAQWSDAPSPPGSPPPPLPFFPPPHTPLP